MKRILCLFLLSFSLILMACEMPGLKEEENDFTFVNHMNETEYELMMSEVDMRIIKMVCEDYCEKYLAPQAKVDDSYPNTPEETQIARYLGFYNNCFIAVYDIPLSLSTNEEVFTQVEEFYFNYSDIQQLLVWFDGEFYSLTASYDLGLISRDNIVEMFDRYYGGEAK